MGGIGRGEGGAQVRSLFGDMLSLGGLGDAQGETSGQLRVDLDPRDEKGVRDTYVLGAHRAVTGAVMVAVQETPREGKQSEERGPGWRPPSRGAQGKFSKTGKTG